MIAHGKYHLSILLAGLLLLVGFGAASPVTAQESPRFGLSAAPDHYDSEIHAELNQAVTLYIIATGFDDGDPIPFDVHEFEWIIVGPC